jgi:FkbM family methyltransferase
MRRLKILFYWFVSNKNNVSLRELIRFLFIANLSSRAQSFIKNIEKRDFYEVTFQSIPHKLYWPLQYPVEGIYMVTTETFDKKDWHFYQNTHTAIEQNEILLDIGTAEGLFPLTVINDCKKIIMIEPNRYFFASLQKTFAPYQDKVHIVHSAVGNQDGEIFFEGDSLSSHVAEKNEQSYPVTIHKIDYLVNDEPKITYLKADIEGFEEEMLKGAEQTIKRHKPKIAITTYHTGNNPANIIAIIQSYVPEYKYYAKGIHQDEGKPVMIHFWI